MTDYSDTDDEKSRNVAMLVYILMLATPLLLVSPLIGIIFAYVYRDDAPEWLTSHYQLQIRTFWIACLFFFFSLILMIVLIGKLLLLLTLIWFLVRMIKGIRYLNRRAPYPNPTSWGF